MNRRRVVATVAGTLAAIVGFAASALPGAAAPSVPSACRVLTPADVAAATARPAPPAGRPERLDQGRGSYCSYDISGGYVDGGPDGATLAMYWSPLRAGRRFIVGTSKNIAEDTGPLTRVADGPGTRADLGGDIGFRQLLVRDGRRTLLLDVQVKAGSPVSDADLEAWLLALAAAALG